jgi:hypothetical protein
LGGLAADVTGKAVVDDLLLVIFDLARTPA